MFRKTATPLGKNSNVSDQLDFENYRHVVHKWHFNLTKVIWPVLPTENLWKFEPCENKFVIVVYNFGCLVSGYGGVLGVNKLRPDSKCSHHSHQGIGSQDLLQPQPQQGKRLPDRKIAFLLFSATDCWLLPKSTSLWYGTGETHRETVSRREGKAARHVRTGHGVRLCSIPFCVRPKVELSETAKNQRQICREENGCEGNFLLQLLWSLEVEEKHVGT